MLRSVLATDSNSFDANYALGVLYDRVGRADLSVPLLRKAVGIRPDAFAAILNLGIVERDQGLLADALGHIHKAVSIKPDSTAALNLLGSIHIDCNDRDAAIDAFLSALALEPGSDEINTKLASLYAMSGDPDAAAARFRTAIRHHPLSGAAHYGLAFLRPVAAQAEDVERMELAFQSAAISNNDRVLVGLALAKSYENLAQYDQAFHFVFEANQLQQKSIRYSYADQRALFERHEQALNQDFIAYCENCRIDDDTLILVLGMPRSGTSLVEQILASHPLVHGAGEVEYSRFLADDVRKMTGRPFPQNIGTIAPQRLRDLGLDYIQRLKSNAGSAQRVVDKLPHNFLRIGLFAALMPNAKIVLCDRQPLDNCMSIYQHHLSADHGYASDLSELGRYYKLYEDLMSYWMQLFPGRIYRINYENLVAAADAQIRELLRYCELPFHSDCLSFYETERMVVTPSALQVREPIHNISIGRAKHYERYLQTLIDALARDDSVT